MNTQLTEHIQSAFEKHFNQAPLLVASPGRINLIGEHTDYNNGFVFPASIDKYIIAAFSKSDNKLSYIYSIDFDEGVTIDLNNFEKQETGSWKNYVFGVIDELQKRGIKLGNFNLVFGGNIPLGAGLSSSAALENSIVFGLNELFDLGISKEEMALISMYAEHHFAGVECGIMDQFSIMSGKAGNALFLDCRDLSYEQVSIQLEDYQLILINTNVKHQLAGSAYNKRKSECSDGLRILQSKYPQLQSLRDANSKQLNALKEEMPPIIFKRCLYVIEENERVKAAKMAIQNNQWKNFGQLLFASHHGLQHLYEVSCPELDFLVEQARNHGAVIGSRMMGGGFGGCTLNLIQNDSVEDFISKVTKDYYRKFNQSVSFYPVHIADGTHIVQTF